MSSGVDVHGNEPNVSNTTYDSPDDPPSYVLQLPGSSDIPPPYTSSTRILHIYQDGLVHKNLTIKDSDKSTSLYTVTCHKPGTYHRKIDLSRSLPFIYDSAQYTLPTGSSVGKVNFDILHEIEVLHRLQPSVNDRHFIMVKEPEAWEFCFDLRDSYYVKWIYKRRKESCPILWCVLGSTGKWIAKLKLRTLKGFTMFKVGTLELGSCGLDQYMIDELVLTGLTMLELHIVQTIS